MVDTRAQLNLLKKHAISPETPINKNRVYNLIGIDSGTICTCGEITTHIRSIDVEFQMVDVSFPLNQAGILDISFFRK